MEIKFGWPVGYEYDEVLSCRVAKFSVGVEEEVVTRGRKNENRPL